MSQALSPSFACCYGLARVARVWKISRASVYRSLKEMPPNIESDDVVNYCFPKEWPADREQRARYIGEWLKTEARYLA
jgi:hypothetical protein